MATGRGTIKTSLTSHMKLQRPTTWQLQAAKAQFSEVVRRALTEGPQYVTRQGEEAVVVVPTAEFERLKRRDRKKGSLAEFFANSPLRGSGIDLERKPDFGRKIKL
jgi:prevent-host-death family protein